MSQIRAASEIVADTTFVVDRWSVARGWAGATTQLRRWWLDYRTREGLRNADPVLLLEAGLRRSGSGELEPMAPRRHRSVRRPIDGV